MAIPMATISTSTYICVLNLRDGEQRPKQGHVGVRNRGKGIRRDFALVRGEAHRGIRIVVPLGKKVEK